MSKQIWLGPIFGGNRRRLLSRCSEVLAEGFPSRLLYLTASHPLLELVTARLLDRTPVKGLWGSLHVYLFRGFVRHLLATAVEEETGLFLPERSSIDREDLPLARSVLSQLIRRLVSSNGLTAFAPLAESEGCINSIAKVIGEIERAGKTANEFKTLVERREANRIVDGPHREQTPPGTVPRQHNYDRDLALIYSKYNQVLDRYHLTEEDADQLQAFAVLKGKIDGTKVAVPWLQDLRLLVVDGFFDFTPVQGEMLRLLIQHAPEVIVNLNWDNRNPTIFKPLETTLEQLRSMAPFETRHPEPYPEVEGRLERLKSRLFNPSDQSPQAGTDSKEIAPPPETHLAPTAAQIIRFKCSNRLTEIRAIAKEVKRLVNLEGYALGEIALVVRERASYAVTIERVFREEKIPIKLESRIPLAEVPAVRAAIKLLDLLTKKARSGGQRLKAAELADLLKSGYFRLDPGVIRELCEQFRHQKEERLATSAGEDRSASSPGIPDERLPRSLGVGRWDVDELENVIAYVGSELHFVDWLDRAQKLTAAVSRMRHAGRSPSSQDLQEDEYEDFEGPGEGDREEASDRRSERPEQKPGRRRDIHPDTIEWAALALQRVYVLLAATPHQGGPEELRAAVLHLFEQLRFPQQIRRPMRARFEEIDLEQTALDLRGLEGLRRSFLGAVRSIAMVEETLTGTASAPASLATLIDEVKRCIHAQTMRVRGADSAGLAVLEATDIRGLRFRAVFIAGLVEGGFPLRSEGDWIYPHDERVRLKESGLTLEDISPDTLLKEEHFFYQAACRATERLYLTRPVTIEEGTESVASYFLDEPALNSSQFQEKHIRADYDGNELLEASTPLELTLSVVRQSERRRHSLGEKGLLPATETDRLLTWSERRGYLTPSTMRRIGIERLRADGLFGPFDGEITHAQLVALLSRRFGEEHKFSASQLNLYGNCPYKFFADRVLQLESRNEAALDLKALESGQLQHEILRRFFSAHRSQSLTQLDREQLKQELRAISEEVFAEYEEEVPPLNQRIWSIDKEILTLVLDQVLSDEIELQSRTGQRMVLPSYFELGFGIKGPESDPASTEDLLVLLRKRSDDGVDEAAQFHGQIDRVDVGSDGTLIAYDYKRSQGANVRDMKEGRDFQIGIYLAALERLFKWGGKIAGGGYYLLRCNGARRNQGLYNAEFMEYTQIGKQAHSNVAEKEWLKIRARIEENIWRAIDGMRSGRFWVTPSLQRKTCEHCDFGAVCRYEPYRIQKKLAMLTDE